MFIAVVGDCQICFGCFCWAVVSPKNLHKLFTKLQPVPFQVLSAPVFWPIASCSRSRWTGTWPLLCSGCPWLAWWSLPSNVVFCVYFGDQLLVFGGFYGEFMMILSWFHWCFLIYDVSMILKDIFPNQTFTQVSRNHWMLPAKYSTQLPKKPKQMRIQNVYILHDVLHGATFPPYEWQKYITHCWADQFSLPWEEVVLEHQRHHASTVDLLVHGEFGWDPAGWLYVLQDRFWKVSKTVRVFEVKHTQYVVCFTFCFCGCHILKVAGSSEEGRLDQIDLYFTAAIMSNLYQNIV